jgi:hypothetical protein
MVLRVVAGQAAREVPGGLPPSGASSFIPGPVYVLEAVMLSSFAQPLPSRRF